jgi:ABC-type Fe3+/spermidine/putrescine transport system ATPase subunit
MADRIVVMNKGQIEQIGPPNALFESPQTRFVAEFVGDNNIFEGTVISSRTEGHITVESKGCQFNLIIRDGKRPPKDKDVTFIVRADKIQILPSEKKSREAIFNSIPARIIGQEYIGSIIKYTLNSEQFGILHIIQPVRSYHDAEDVLIGWHAEHTHLLPW